MRKNKIQINEKNKTQNKTTKKHEEVLQMPYLVYLTHTVVVFQHALQV